MKTKADPVTAAEAVRIASLKVAKVQQIAKAQQRLAQTAKARFKSAKKNWKVARKAAKRSAQAVKLAEKNLEALEKHQKRVNKKVGKKKSPPKPAAQKNKKSRPVRAARKELPSVRPPSVSPAQPSSPTSGGGELPA